MLIGLLFIPFLSSAQPVRFSAGFAPTGDFVKPPEQPFRDAVCLNGYWQFMPAENAGELNEEELKNPALPENPTWEKIPVKVPSPWNVNSFAQGNGGDFVTYPGYPEKWDTIRAGWLMKKIPYDPRWKNKRLVLRFEAIAGYAKVFVNGQEAGENFDLFLPVEWDVTDKIKRGENEIRIWVADAALFDEPGKYGTRTHVAGSFWGQHAIGIWQDVWLLAKPEVNIQNLFVKPFFDKDELQVEVIVSNHSSERKELEVSGSVMPWINLAAADLKDTPAPRWKLGAEVLKISPEKVVVEPGDTLKLNLKVNVSGRLKNWSSETPNLYGLVVSLNEKNKPADKKYERFGWRQFSLVGDQFFLNGEKIVLKGDSWHFMGIPQMTRRYAWAWYRMLKDCGANAVRLHAQPYPEFYLDMADEMGLFILDETGIWASDGGPKADSEKYWANCEDHLERLILRDRNHPSVLGWSVCNENLPVVINVQRAPEAVIRRQVEEINKWVHLTEKLDPTRSWISGDGETNRPTDLPVVIGHYGREREYQQWSSQGKLWGIGEGGMAYAGTPREAANFGGDRAYESQLGRMEGVAAEASELLNLQKKYKASFLSVFNIVWYGLKPLELGLKDTSRAPELSDGVFFAAYREGQAGVQPERLGPYCTTLNPGYDPALPLYKTWPLFDAVQTSFLDTGLINLQQKNKNETSGTTAEFMPPTSRAVLLSADQDSVLYKILSELGIEVSTKPELASGIRNILLIDGKFPPHDQESQRFKDKVLQQGGIVWILGIDPRSVKALNKFLPEPAETTSRKSTSFIVKAADSLLNGLNNADFYFSEMAKNPVMLHGLSGPFVNGSLVLLEACNTDWNTWNHKPESYKTAAVLRSEREAKEAGSALVVRNSGNGKIYLSALDAGELAKTSPSLLRLLFLNLGLKPQSRILKNAGAVNAKGVLEKALVIGSFASENRSLEQSGRFDFLGEQDTETYFSGNRLNGRFWEAAKADEGIFDFKKMNLSGPNENAVAYVSFWLYSPRSLVDLLVAPDMPRLDLFIGADDAFQLLLNGRLIKEDLNEGGLKRREQLVKALPLEQGWNHVLIKVMQGRGDWKLAVEFESDQEQFLKEMKSKINP
ncbi:MAG: sugar-binding domain-containing protein [Prolixibacteraceae bacterium]